MARVSSNNSTVSGPRPILILVRSLSPLSNYASYESSASNNRERNMQMQFESSLINLGNLWQIVWTGPEPMIISIGPGREGREGASYSRAFVT